MIVKQLKRILNTNDLINKTLQGKAPDFVGIGMPKAGTSWWYEAIINHPEVSPNNFGVKETCCLCHAWQSSSINTIKSAYFQSFGTTDNKLSGEWSTFYLTYPFALEYLAEIAPNTKILLILRNPYDQILSHLNHIRNHRAKSFAFNDQEKNYVFDTFSVLPEVISNIQQLPNRLNKLFQLFDRSNVLILQYERNCLESLVQIKKTYKFLGIDCDFVPSNISERVNASPPDYKNELKLDLDKITDVSNEISKKISLILPEINTLYWE